MNLLMKMTLFQFYFSGLGWQLFIFLQFSISHGLGVRYQSGSLRMKTMKPQKRELTAWSTRYDLNFNTSLVAFVALYGIYCPSTVIALAGLWSLFHADIYWSFLSCPLAPQFFDSPPSLDSAPPCVWGEVDLFLSFLLIHYCLALIYSWTGNVIQVLENLLENSLPYLKYSYKKYRVR